MVLRIWHYAPKINQVVLRQDLALYPNMINLDNSYPPYFRHA